MIHVACACDANYVPHCAALLHSLVEHVPDRQGLDRDRGDDTDADQRRVHPAGVGVPRFPTGANGHVGQTYTLPSKKYRRNRDPDGPAGRLRHLEPVGGLLGVHELPHEEALQAEPVEL